jgi:hypothetical protein
MRLSPGGEQFARLSGLKRLFAFGNEDEQIAVRNRQAAVFGCIFMAFCVMIHRLWT